MIPRQCFVKTLGLTAAVFILSALHGNRLAAQEKSWVGEQVLHTKPAKDIKFGDRVTLQLLAQAFNLTNRANYGNNFGVGGAASIADPTHFGHPQGFINPSSTIIPHALWGELGARFTF